MTISHTEHIFQDMIKQNMDQRVDGTGFVFDEHVKINLLCNGNLELSMLLAASLQMHHQRIMRLRNQRVKKIPRASLTKTVPTVTRMTISM